eukprot:NODE_1444_length_949_cov_270.892222_g1118_i0.p2 GENE.NODE_1444_length_949_cov_270.892222_g1118_i0~~NODE_1444_length_949_cov_270.892222_g1118_i0.p2  ORF type:complete len:62 (-),score=11.17 NODE_1444_length_949_cov_270.892222_g1118_i0:476-661(-)
MMQCGFLAVTKRCAAIAMSHFMACCLVQERAVSMACGSLDFQWSATSFARGSSGLGALRSA